MAIEDYGDARKNSLTVLLLIAVIGLNAGVSAAPSDAILVVPAHVDPSLEALSDGLSEHLQQRLASAGLSVKGGAEVRSVRRRHGNPTLTTQQALSIAAELGTQRVLVLDLRVKQGLVETAIRLYQGSPPRLRGIAHDTAPLAELGASADRALTPLLTPLDALTSSLSSQSPPSSGTLASLSRALEHLDDGRLVAAWTELAGRDGSAVWALRKQLRRQASADTTQIGERAGLMAATGEMDSAWNAIEKAATSKAAGPSTLVAAGEVQLERGEIASAQLYFERVLSMEPDSSRASLGLARTHALVGNEAAARKVLEGAADREQEQPDPRILEQLSRHHEDSPKLQAHLLLLAGRVGTERLDSRQALDDLRRAVRLDPELAGPVELETANLHLRMGRHRQAVNSYSKAVELQGEDPDGLRRLADTQLLLGDTEKAVTTYERARELAPADPTILLGLGRALNRAEQPAEAAKHLEAVTRVRPRSAPAIRELARSRSALGQGPEALELHRKADRYAPPGSAELLEVANIRRELGDLEGARQALEQAVTVEPTALDPRVELAEIEQQEGVQPSAERAYELQLMLASLDEGEVEFPHDALAALVGSFVERGSGAIRLGFLGMRRRSDLRDWRTWLDPRSVDTGTLDARVSELLEQAHALDTAASQADRGPELSQSIDQLYGFESEESRDPRGVARVNRILGTEAVALGRILSGPAAVAADCGRGDLHVELRILQGQLAREARIRANSICLPGGAAQYRTWNLYAAASCALIISLIALVLRVGWGTLVVDFRLPPGASALFSVRLALRKKIFDMDPAAHEAQTRFRFEDKLRRLNMFEKRLEGSQVIFRRLPAFTRPYHVIVRGPLVDSTTKQLIGVFQASKRARVRRRGEVKLEFDLKPDRCPLEVSVSDANGPAQSACVALLGDPKSLRYSHGKNTFLYTDKGMQVVLAGLDGSLAAQKLEIDSFDRTSVYVDFGREEQLLFRDCPDAMTLLMNGDPRAAIEALEARRDSAGAACVRELLGQGDPEKAGQRQQARRAIEIELEDEHEEDTERMLETPTQPGNLHEDAGEFRLAAKAYLEEGDRRAAAQAFERAGEHSEAITLWRELDDREGLLRALESGGQSFDAALLALEEDQVERAIHDLTQVERFDECYLEACWRLGQLHARRGDTELAIQCFEEASQDVPDGIPIDVELSYAHFLEEHDHVEKALSVYEKIQGRDPEFGDVGSRIEVLSKLVTELREQESPPPGSSEAGPQEDRYEILGELGRGGMGVVYRARDRYLGRVVALKMLPDNLRENERAVQYFLREARAAAALNHPNIVTLFDAGQENSKYFISMECLEGKPFDAILKQRGPLDARTVALLGSQVVLGLHYAHSSQIVHRDIKTSNLFYTRERIVKIMDFGLARMIEEVRRAATMIAGTPYYMAPEQATGESIDHRADLYALGVTFFNMLTGRFPFEEGDVAYHHRYTPPPDAREFAPQTPEPFAQLMQKLMAKQPDERCASAEEVADVLRQMIGS